MAADLRTLMRRFVNRLDQKEFVRLLNEQFTTLSSQGSFSTAVVTTFFAPSRRLTLQCWSSSSAALSSPRWPLVVLGHRTILKRRGRATFRSASFNLPTTRRQTSNSTLATAFVSYTDALIESCDTDGEMLDEEGLLRIVNLLGDIPAEKLIATILQEIDSASP